MFLEGASRGFHSTLGDTSLPTCLRKAGYHTALISPFPERHSAWWFTAGFSETFNTGKKGLETSRSRLRARPRLRLAGGGTPRTMVVSPYQRLGRPHPVPPAGRVWQPLFERSRAARPGSRWRDPPKRTWNGRWGRNRRRMRRSITASPKARRRIIFHTRSPPADGDGFDGAASKRMFDGYDTGIRYADDFVGRILASLKAADVYEDTAIIVSSDHGENLGELNSYMIHMLADEATCHVPLIIRWPGITDALQGRAMEAVHCHVDLGATVVELAGGNVPANSGCRRAFCPRSLRAGRDEGTRRIRCCPTGWPGHVSAACGLGIICWTIPLGHPRCWISAFPDHAHASLLNVADATAHAARSGRVAERSGRPGDDPAGRVDGADDSNRIPRPRPALDGHARRRPGTPAAARSKDTSPASAATGRSALGRPPGAISIPARMPKGKWVDVGVS